MHEKDNYLEDLNFYYLRLSDFILDKQFKYNPNNDYRKFVYELARIEIAIQAMSKVLNRKPLCYCVDGERLLFFYGYSDFGRYFQIKAKNYKTFYTNIFISFSNPRINGMTVYKF